MKGLRSKTENGKEIFFLDVHDPKKIKDLLIIKDEDDFQNIVQYCDSLESEDWDDHYLENFLVFDNGNRMVVEKISDIASFEYEVVEITTPEPAFYFSKIIKIEEHELEVFTGNTSGSLAPYWDMEK
jgi:chemotaxis protein CheY-P-specific phosphatase CheC